MASPVRIVVDTREDPAIAAALGRVGAEVVRRRLSVADFEVGHGALVERKRIFDVHVSLMNGRLWRQIGALRKSSHWAYLVVEGTNIDAGPVSAAAVRGTVLALMEQGVRVIQSRDLQDSAQWIHRLATRMQRQRRPRTLPEHAFRRRVPAEPAEAVLAAVPGLGITSARALLVQFGTIGELIAAGPEALQRTPGIGPRRAASIAAVFNCSARSAE